MADPINFPDDLSQLTDDELADLESAATDEFNRLQDEGSRDIAAMTGLVDGIESCRAERGRREAAAAEEDAAIAELAARLAGPEATDSDTGGDEEPDPDEEEGAEEPEGELVTASATPPVAPTRRPTLAAVQARAPRPNVPAAKPAVTLTAAADVPGMPTGGRYASLSRVAEAFHDKARLLRDGAGRAPVVRIERPIPAEHRFTDDPAHNQGVLDRLITDRLNNGGAKALVASGGWCVPSQPIYDMFQIGDADGLLDLPRVGATRGGILVPSFYTQADVTGALWTWTEANDIAGATQPAGPDKPCLKIPCPTWTDYRLIAYGVCVTHGNLSDRAFPELTRSYLNLVAAAHEHAMSTAKITAVSTGATAVTMAASDSDAAGDLLNALSLQAADLRSQYKASRNRVVEVLLPEWTFDVLRANVAKRAGVDLIGVTDQEVMSWITSANVRPQFLSDYQPMYSASPKTDWPTSLEFLMFFSGAYVEGDGGSIDLGVVRDSTLNSTNDFTAAWSEEFSVVARVGPLARKVTMTLDTDGVTACCA